MPITVLSKRENKARGGYEDRKLSNFWELPHGLRLFVHVKHVSVFSASARRLREQVWSSNAAEWCEHEVQGALTAALSNS